MFPHERSLVERYQKDPFALVGINLDSSRQTLQKTVEKDQINWRNGWDGDGRISTGWRIQGLPTLFVIDPKGIIRRIHLGAPDPKKLEDELEKLIAEAKDPPAA